MDLYCIGRGTLLDNPSVKTLVNPEKHSVHCLVDVGVCTGSGYEVLIDPAGGSDDVYSRGIRLDDAGNQQVIALARATGSCSTCSEGGSLESGFRATVNGTITSLGNESTPVSIQTVWVDDASVGCGDFVFIPPSNVITNIGSQRSSINLLYFHGSLMIISLCLMLL